MLFVGLVLQNSTALADESFFDSFTKAIKTASNNVRNQLNQMIDAYTQDTSPQDSVDAGPALPATAAAATPAPAPVPTGPQLSDCRKYLGYAHDPSEYQNPVQVATVYLNAVLDFQEEMGTDLDAKISDDEMNRRNACAQMALDAGADPNSNAEYNDKDGMMKDIPSPLVRAVNNNDEAAVKLLLARNANPNVDDASLGQPIPLIKSALSRSTQEIVLDLIHAGADITIPGLLWSASASGLDQVVDALIQSQKIPVNQITKFSDDPSEVGQTALDVSESNLDALNGYQKKFPTGSSASLQDKFLEADRILYYHYPMMPQLNMRPSQNQPSVDPDVFMSKLLQRQQHISQALKSAGWKCQQDNCGILVFDSNDDQSSN